MVRPSSHTRFQLANDNCDAYITRKEIEVAFSFPVETEENISILNSLVKKLTGHPTVF